MGFFKDLGNAFMGKPLQPPSDNNAQQTLTAQQAPVDPNTGLVNERGYKIIPDIDFKQLRSQRQSGGKQLIVKALVVNNSDQPIRIDTSYLLKQNRTHNQDIRPRDSRELLLYQGDTPDDDNETKSHIAYRLQVNGDVFMEQYRVEFARESDGKFVVTELIDDGPVRDI